MLFNLSRKKNKLPPRNDVGWVGNRSQKKESQGCWAGQVVWLPQSFGLVHHNEVHGKRSKQRVASPSLTEYMELAPLLIG